MAIFFTDKTALDFWQWQAATRSIVEHPCPMGRMSVTGAPDSRADILASCSHFVQDDANENSKAKEKGPLIDILVPSSCEQRRYSNVRCHVNSEELPYGSLWRLAKKLYVSSPEHLFLRYALKASRIELIAIGYALTANYIIWHEEIVGIDQALTTPAALARYLDRCAGMRGSKEARRALQYIAANSASPRETQLSMLFSLPRRYGGYGLPRPQLNEAIMPSKREATRLGEIVRRPDLLWASAKIAIEYESTMYHRGDEKFVSDSKRRNDIRHMGYDVTTITNNEFKSIERMDRIAADIRKNLGMRVYREPANFAQKHYELRKLFRGMDGMQPERQDLCDFWG